MYAPNSKGYVGRSLPGKVRGDFEIPVLIAKGRDGGGRGWPLALPGTAGLESGFFVVWHLGSFGSSFFGDFSALEKATNRVARAVINMARTPTRILSGKGIALTGFGGLAMLALSSDRTSYSRTYKV
jgi:hypothetical protein